MVGIGPFELLIVLIVGVLAIAVPLGIVILLVVQLQKQKNSNGDSARIAKLEEENQRLRDELARRKETPAR